MDKLMNFYKMLSDETRLRIIILLYHQELCVCEICGILDLSQPKVSKHLAKLRDKGFVKDERKEQFIFYRLNLEDKILKDTVQSIIDNLENYPDFQRDVERLAVKETFLEQCKLDNLSRE
jgi:ArsR family transcriptional regulator